MDVTSALPDHDRMEMRERRLRRMKGIALACLLTAVALLVLSHAMGRQGAWAWVGAFSEAATVGALADWFAVVALFRHPLGLPIPHTAIIPRNQARIADNLAVFVHDKFLAREQLLAKVDAWNPARRLGEFLGAEDRLDTLARRLQAWARRSLQALDAPEIEREVLALARRQLEGWNAAATAGQLLRVLTHGDHHQRVLNAGLSQVATWLDQPEVRGFITGKVVAMARREFPKLVWLTDKLKYTDELADAVATRLSNAMIEEVQAVLNDPAHPLRARYGAEAERLLQRLERDPALQARVQAFKQRLIDSAELQEYVQRPWHQTRDWLQADLAREDSRLAGYFRTYARRLGSRLRDDAVWQQAANAQIRIAAEYLADQLRELAPRYIRQTVEAWDTRYLSDEIERSVGRDLQFIRLNGTLIGGLAGLLLHALLQLPWAHWVHWLGGRA